MKELWEWIILRRPLTHRQILRGRYGAALPSGVILLGPSKVKPSLLIHLYILFVYWYIYHECCVHVSPDFPASSIKGNLRRCPRRGKHIWMQLLNFWRPQYWLSKPMSDANKMRWTKRVASYKQWWGEATTVEEFPSNNYLTNLSSCLNDLREGTHWARGPFQSLGANLAN